jgi:uncharacterized repeat protein (TIGR01451 family)/uncharacterized delta-60 repeat protein
MQTVGSFKRICLRPRAGAVKLGGLVLAGLLPLGAFAAGPPNDNWANAFVLVGDFGTTNGSTVNATAEPGEPNHAGLKATQSIWYKWTASSDAPVEFDTFNSKCDTVLAVYTGTNVTRLTQVVANDDVNTTNPENSGGRPGNDPFIKNPYLGPSGVKFNARAGTTYYIAVDGTFKKGSSPPAQGAVTLSWAYNSSGVFRLSRSTQSHYAFGGLINFVQSVPLADYFATDAESDNPGNGSYSESARGARITVTRLFGSAGKAIVTFDLQDGTAVAGTDYKRPANTNLIFDDFETTKSFIVPIIDDNGLGSVNGNRNPGRIGVPNNPGVRNFTVFLTNVVLDPLEDGTVLAPPRFDKGTAFQDHTAAQVDILDMDGPVLLDPLSPTLGITNGVVNFERAVYRVKEGAGTAHIKVYRSLGGDTSKGTEIHYEIDTTWFPEAFTDDNGFDLEAGSDYAAPMPDNSKPSLNPDFGGTNGLAVNHGDLNGTVTDGVTIGTFGTLRWNGNGDFTPKSIDIPIFNDTLPEFNEDINVFLFQIAGHNQDAEIGWNISATVTILYDDYPAGALDDANNRDFDIGTDPPNNSLPGADNTVYSLVVQSNDNKTVIVGNFGAYDSFPRYGIARLNADGTCDQTFDPADGIPVKDPINPSFLSSVAMDSSGRFIIGGSFPSYNGTPRYNIARVNTDGSLDGTFNPGLGATQTVWTVAALTNGQVLIGGEFTMVNNVLRQHIARLNADGSLDSSFDPGTNGPNGTVNAIAVAPDGTIYIGGDFTSVGGLARSSVAQLDTNGLVVPNFTPVAGVNGPVFALALQPDGKLVVGGSFSVVEFQSRNNIARYNPNGSLDGTFNPGSGANDSVYTLTLQNDGGIFLGGLFTSVNQTRRMGLARLFSSGEVDTGFLDTAYNQFAGLHHPYFNPFINSKDFLFATGLQPDGNLMIGGSFRYVGGGRFDSQVQTNSVDPFDGVAETRAGYRNRNNVARLLGGTTEGPGSISLVATNYSVVENMGFLYIKAARTNGSLGRIETTFSLPPRPGSNTIGIAQSGVDYLYNRINPRFDTTWAGNRELSECIIGTNNISTDRLGDTIRSGLADINVTIPNIAGYQGDRRALFQLDSPSFADIFYLGGENIPIGSALGQTFGAILTIQENFTSPGVLGFSVPNFSVNENATNAVITIVRTNGSVGPISVRFATTNGTALTGTDYIGLTNTVTFRDGQTSTNVNIPIINNSVIAPDKTVNLYLASPGNGSALGTLSNAVLTIINDNFLPGRLNFDNTAYTTNETAPAFIIPVTRTGGNVGVLDIQYATSNLTAVAGVNYANTVGTLHWDDHDAAPRSIRIPLARDGLVTPNLQFTINLFNPSIAGALGTRIVATNTIINQDFFGQLQFSSASYNVNENGGFATITVVRVGGSAQTVTANFSTADGTALQFNNYFPTNGSLVFAPGEVSKSFNVRLRDDLTQDPPGFYFGVLLNNITPAGSVGSPTFAQVNILDAFSFNQPPGQLDPSFNPSLFFNDDVYSVALQPGGQIVAAGNFTIVNGQPINRIVRLNNDGTLDSSFLVPTLGGANDAIRSVISQSDTRLVVGGVFTTFDGVVRNSLARLNYDGNIDPGFNPGSGAAGTIFALAETFLGSGRRIYVGGGFNTFSGALISGVVRLNDDGTVDSVFNPGQTIDGTVYAVAVYPTNSAHAGQLVIGGDFTSVGGQPHNRIARLNADGSLDPNFDPTGAGVDNTIRAIVLQSDGAVVIGGAFTNVQGVARNRIARLNASDGSLDTTFQVGQGANDLVYSLALQPDNRIVVGGAFTRASGVTRNRLTRLMPNGAADPAINFGSGADNYVGTIAIQPDGKLVIGGGFTQFQGLSRPHLARIYGGSVIGSGAFRFNAANYDVDENGTNVLITVIRTGGTSGPLSDGSGSVSVEFRTTDGTAVAGVNYSNVDVFLNFPAGETVQSVLVPVLDDLQVTPDLTVNLALINPTPPAVLGPQPTALLTINNVESAISFSSPTYSRAEDAVDGAATIAIERVGSTRNTATVDFITTTNGSAVPGVNYTPVTNTVTFLPNQTEQLVKVPIFHTPQAEGDKTVSLILTNSLGALLLTPFQAMLTIIDVDQAPGQFLFSRTNYVVSEGGGSALITILRTNGHSGVVSVDFSTIPGTATPGLKYLSTNGTMNFGDGEVAKSFAVPILEENQVEGTEFLSLLLGNATGGASIVGANPVPLAILDDDIGVSFSTNSFLNAVYVVSETNSLVIIDVFRLNTTNGTTQVSYATTNGTAFAGVDYVPVSGVLTFRPGESRSSIAVSILRDPAVTGDLTFSLNLSNPSPGVQLANPSTATVVINDVDTGLRLSDTNSPPVANAQYSVLKNGTNITVTVLRTNASTGLVQVNYNTADGTAQANTHYTPVSGLLTFTNGQSSNSFTIPIINTLAVQGNLNFSVSLANPVAPGQAVTPQLLPPSSATITIVDTTSGFSFSRPSYDFNQNDGLVSIGVQRTGFTNSTVSVDFTTQDGTATHGQGGDYDTSSGTLTFTNGQTTTNIFVQLHSTTLLQPDKTVLLRLFNNSPGNSTALVNPSAAILTIHNVNGSFVIPAGVALVSESFAPPDGLIEPGETVRLLFAFRNAGGTNTANLTATLLATNGVTAPSAAQSYGVLVTNGPSVSRAFTFTASATNGQQIAATFLLQDNGHAVGTNAGLALFTFNVGTNSASFTNSSQITINDFTTATPYPSLINISGVGGVVNKATVSLNNVNHSSPSDIDALLDAPANQVFSLVMAHAGGGFGLNQANLTFDDAATNGFLPQGAQITNGTYKPTAYYPVPALPAPAPPPNGVRYTNSLGVFKGINPNGGWGLYVIDDSQGNAGVISNGWVLNLTLANPVGSNSDLGLTMTGSPDIAVLTSNVTYTLTVNNHGPAAASGVTVSNLLAASFVSASASQGSFATNGAGVLTWNIGGMATNGTAILTLVVLPPTTNNAGSFAVTNIATVTAGNIDLNPANDTAAVVTTVVTPTADLAMGIAAAPSPAFLGANITYTLTVSNLGPATAPAVIVTNGLPPNVTFVSATPGYTLSGGTVTFTNLGNIGNGGQASATIVVQAPLVSATLTNAAGCFSLLIIDPFKGNNKATIKTLVNAVPMSFSRQGNSFVISWPVGTGNYILESTANLAPPAVWTAVTNPPVAQVAGQNTVTMPVGNARLFFRLRAPLP